MNNWTIHPKVSILIPLYNSEKYIAETLQSAIGQTWPNKEIIVVDDGSTDQSYAIAKSFESEMVKLYKNSGKGACAARNYAFELSSGDYIQYLDADDLLSPSKIEKQINAIKEGTAGKVAVCSTWHFHTSIENGFCTDENSLFTTDQPEAFFINLWGGGHCEQNMVAVSAWLTPRNLIETAGPWNESLAKDQDGEFFARTVLRSKGVIYVPGIKNYYRKFIKGTNITWQNKTEHIESVFQAIHLKKKYLLSLTDSPEAKKAIATQYKLLAINAWPQYKEISQKAEEECRLAGGTNYLPVLGGRTIETIKWLAGWKTAKAISIWGHNQKWMVKLAGLK